MSKGNNVKLKADVRNEFTRLRAESFAKTVDFLVLYTVGARRASR